MTERPTLAVGLMSGTSLDGVDAALVRFNGPTRVSLLAFVTRPYADAERARIRAVLDGAGPRESALPPIQPRVSASLNHARVKLVSRATARRSAESAATRSQWLSRSIPAR